MEEFKKNRPTMKEEEALDLLAHEARTRIGQENAERRAKLDAAVQALREKVAAKKPKRPTLEEMEAAVNCCAITNTGEIHNDLCAAADIIKAVREDTVVHLLEASTRAFPWGNGEDCNRVREWARERLLALGERS